jgi:hypothetical protein
MRPDLKNNGNCNGTQHHNDCDCILSSSRWFSTGQFLNALLISPNICSHSFLQTNLFPQYLLLLHSFVFLIILFLWMDFISVNFNFRFIYLSVNLLWINWIISNHKIKNQSKWAQIENTINYCIEIRSISFLLSLELLLQGTQII